MKKNLLTSLAWIICILLPVLMTNAQVKTKIFENGIPADLVNARVKTVPEKIVSPPVGFSDLLKQSNQDHPLEYSNQFAVPREVNLDFLPAAQVVESGESVLYVIRLKAENALNISLVLKDFRLPESGILSIHTQHELTDSITAKENNANNLWATRVYQGNEVTLSLKIPAKEKLPASPFIIEKIFFGFKHLGGEFFGNPGGSVACNINVNCPEGNGWQNERNSVALIAANGFLCTGSLIMNTCGSNIPYFLTANHCLNAGDIPNWVFQFQYWSATCTPNSGWSESVQFNGCALRANNAATDFALLELNQTPPTGSGLQYNGWSRSTTAPNGSVGIHHPAGDLMKFSRDYDVSGVSSWNGANNHWVSVFEEGTVQPGSSGSPLYDMNHRVVGQLHGDQQNQGNYCLQRRGEYGRFDLSWTGGSTNATRLSNWLDPSNSNAMTTNTTSIDALSTVQPSLSIGGGSDNLCSSATYHINGLPAGASVCWSVSNPGIASIPNPSCGNSVTATKQGDGSVILTANVTLCGGATFATNRTLTVGNPFPTGTTWATSNYNYYNGTLLSSYSFFLPSGQSGTAQFNVSDPRYSNITWTPISTPSGTSWSSAGANNQQLNMSVTASGAAYSSKTITIRMNAQGPCGAFTMDFSLTAVVRGWSFATYPNPVQDNLRIAIQEEPGKDENENLSIMLYNSGSTALLRKWEFKNNRSSYNLNLAGLKKGQYTLVIKKGIDQQSKQIIIE